MIKLTTPRGLPVDVPESAGEDPSPRFDARDTQGIIGYYEENGYVVVGGVFDPAVCDRQRQLWADEVKQFDGYIYRQATAKAERHVLNQNAWVMNPVLNLQSVDPRHFPRFRAGATEQFLCAPALRDIFKSVLSEASPKIVQSMYFEGNSETWEHQDTYYLDSEAQGEMVAAWIALEDIAARAGRFFICPGSHRIRLADHDRHNNIAENHEVYIQSVVAKIRELGLGIRAPRLLKGDVLLWNSRTIHGSLRSQDPTNARSSITCHAIPANKRLLQHQSRLLAVPADNVNGTLVHRPKDQARLLNRAVLGVESRFPSAFYGLKKMAVKYYASRHKPALLAQTHSEQ